jgi:F-type H+-transporting ATPase subunit a
MKKLLTVFFSVLTFAAFAAEPAAEDGKFDPGQMITHHISDAHSWEFAHGATLHLPVILYGKNGLEIFSSANFYDEHHNPQPYKGYVMEHEHIYYADENGKPQVEAQADGTEKHVGPKDFSITKNVASLFLSAILLVAIFFTISLPSPAVIKTTRVKRPAASSHSLSPSLFLSATILPNPISVPNTSATCPTC